MYSDPCARSGRSRCSVQISNKLCVCRHVLLCAAACYIAHVCVQEEAAAKGKKRGLSKPAGKAPSKKRSKARKQNKSPDNQEQETNPDQDNTASAQGKDKDEGGNTSNPAAGKETEAGAQAEDIMSNPPVESQRKPTEASSPGSKTGGSNPTPRAKNVQRAAGSTRKRKLDDEKRKKDQVRADASIQHILGFKEDMGDCRPKNAAKPSFTWSNWKQLPFC